MISNSKKKDTYKNIHTYTYNGKFEGNILVVGRTGCGKTTFVQNVGKKNYLVTLKKSTAYRKLNFLLKERT